MGLRNSSGWQAGVRRDEGNQFRAGESSALIHCAIGLFEFGANLAQDARNIDADAGKVKKHDGSKQNQQERILDQILAAFFDEEFSNPDYHAQHNSPLP